jgi:hypothetical protein
MPDDTKNAPRPECYSVMPALVAGIHVFLPASRPDKTWMAGTTPRRTFHTTETAPAAGVRDNCLKPVSRFVRIPDFTMQAELFPVI